MSSNEKMCVQRKITSFLKEHLEWIFFPFVIALVVSAFVFLLAPIYVSLSLDQNLLQNFLFILFNVTMGVYYIQMLEKWPEIGRFALAGKELGRSAWILVGSWIFLGIGFFVSIPVMGKYFSSIQGGITDWCSLGFYVICLLCFMLIPKNVAGLIYGLFVGLFPEYFWDKVKKAYDENRTLEELYLSKEHIDKFNLRESPKECRTYGKWKSLGNLLWLAAFLFVPLIGWNIRLVLVGIPSALAFFLPKIQKMRDSVT